MLLQALRPPAIIDRLDPAVLTGVQKEFPEQQTGTEWYRDEGREYYPGLLAVLAPLNELLLSRQVGGRMPWAIYYSVDTRVAPPQEAQRPSAWHIDGDGRGMSVVVADVLPTEFLVAQGGLAHHAGHYALLRRARRKQWLRGSEVYDAAIGRGYSAVHQPEPYELAVLKGHIHRSPINPTDTPIPRTWIRAAILPHRPPARADIL